MNRTLRPTLILPPRTHIMYNRKVGRRDRMLPAIYLSPGSRYAGKFRNYSRILVFFVDLDDLGRKRLFMRTLRAVNNKYLMTLEQYMATRQRTSEIQVTLPLP